MSLTNVPLHIKRVSEIYPAPTLDANGRPVNWKPSSVVRENWGRVRVIINGVDQSFIRDVPVQVVSWTTNEPFGDAHAILRFPMVTPFEDPRTLIPEFARIKLQHVLPNNSLGDILFSGMVIDYSHDASQTDWDLTVECLGSFYRFDLQITEPSFFRIVEDVGSHIPASFNFTRGVQGWDLAAMPSVTTGFETATFTAYEKWVTEYYQRLLGVLRDANGDHWTIQCKNDTPVMVLKDRSTTHWTMRVGQRGLETNLKQDLVRPNVIYAEGINENKCTWRNSKFPNIRTEPAPDYPGSPLTVGTDNLYVVQWKYEMARHGYTDTTVGTVYTSQDARVCKRFQRVAGLIETGIVDQQSWETTFNAGTDGSGLATAYIAPLYSDPEVEPALYTPVGGIIGPNPNFDPAKPRIESYINFGNNAQRSVAARDSEKIVKDHADPGWYGTLTLHADPNEGSRFEIRAGENILIQGLHGDDVLLHIAQARVNYEELSVQLEVDSKARDLITLVAMRQRDDDAKVHPYTGKRLGRRTSQQIEDQAVRWDCESSSGRIPGMLIQGGVWKVVKIPAAQYGQVAQVIFDTLPAAKMAVAIFDRPIDAATLNNRGAPTQTNFWKNMPEEWGLLVGWGGEDQMGGYYPGRESDDDPVTGKLVDRSSWYYQSLNPPWLFVACWTNINCAIEGRLFPGATSAGSLPIIGTLDFS